MLNKREPAERTWSIADLFRRAVENTPEAMALLDPPDREVFTDTRPRHLTYAAADRTVTAIADRLLDLGLDQGSIVAWQLPNIAENVLLLLGVLRAGLIAAPMPLLWRQADAVAALRCIGARALITARRVGTIDHGEIAAHVAAEIFAIRFVCGFGAGLPDGVIPLDDVFASGPSLRLRVAEQQIDDIDRVAVVTFDVGKDGILPVAHTQRELVAAGSAIIAEAGLEPEAPILGSLAVGSFASLGAIVMTWLSRQCARRAFWPSRRCAWFSPFGARLSDSVQMNRGQGPRLHASTFRCSARVPLSPAAAGRTGCQLRSRSAQGKHPPTTTSSNACAPGAARSRCEAPWCPMPYLPPAPGEA